MRNIKRKTGKVTVAYEIIHGYNFKFRRKCFNRKLGFTINHVIFLAMPTSSFSWYEYCLVSVCKDLLLLVDMGQRSHLTVLMSPKHLAEGTGGNLAGEAVDVHLLPLVVRTEGLGRRSSCRWGLPGEKKGPQQVITTLKSVPLTISVPSGSPRSPLLALAYIFPVKMTIKCSS